MKNIEILVGPPGSGKSTYAQSFIANGYTYINQDTQGQKEHLNLFTEAFSKGNSIIVDRMNFNKEQRLRYLKDAKLYGYQTSITVFQESRQVCLDRCLSRTDHPTIKDSSSANKAVNFFFSKYEKPTPDEADYITFTSLPREKTKALVCDLDGTLCNIDHRLHLVKGIKPDWGGFFREMSKDKVNPWCAEIIKQFSGTHEIVYCSGRPNDYREITEKWLKDNNLYFGYLFMRSKGDFRQDNIVKEIILDFDILPQFEPTFFLDDRQQVVDMWRRRGFVCLQCAEGNF